MKRTKNLLSVIVALLLAFVMSFALVACGNNGDNGDGGNNGGNNQTNVPDKSAGDLGITEGPEGETKSLLDITIATLPRTSYNLNQEFTSAGLAVRATYLDSTIAPDPFNPDANLVTEPVEASDYVVDSSDFDSSRVGVYTIYVSYTYLGVTRTTSYTVTVNAADPAYGGIIAELVGNDTYTLTDAEPSVEISKDIIAVYAVEADGSKAETPLAADAYNADLYLGSRKIEGNLATENGVYSFVASLVEDESKQDFVPVYVVNPVTKIELDATANGVFQQDAGMVDHMSGTWQFTVTYANGVTKTVKAGDAGLTIELDTRSVGSKKATVTYVEGNYSATCTVSYTILGGGTTQPAGDPLEVNIGELISAGTLKAETYSAEVDIAANDFVKVSVLANESNTVAIDSNSKSADGYSFTHRLKLSGKGTDKARSIKIEVSGAAIITVYMMSSNSSDAREVGIWTGSFDPSPSEGEATAPVVATQTVGGASLEKHEYEVTAAGTYYLAAVSGGTNVYGIIVTPVGGGATQPAPAGDPLEVNIGELISAGTLKAETYSAEADIAANDFVKVSVLANESNTVAIDSNSKSADGYSFTHRLKLSGKGTDKARSIKIEVSGAAIITVYMMSSNSSDAREVGIWTGSFDPSPSEGEATAPVVATQTVGGASLEKHEYEVTAAGTYYLAAVSGGTNVYGIIVTPVGGSSQPSQPSQPAGEALVLNISDLIAAGTLKAETYTEAVVLGANDYSLITALATAESSIAIDSNSKSADGYSFTHRLKLSGKGTDAARSIKIEVSGAAIITVYMMSSNSSDAREVGIWAGSFDPENGDVPVAATQTVGGASLEKHEYEVNAAGTYYLAAVSGGTNVYGIIITPIG